MHLRLSRGVTSICALHTIILLNVLLFKGAQYVFISKLVCIGKEVGFMAWLDYIPKIL